MALVRPLNVAMAAVGCLLGGVAAYGSPEALLRPATLQVVLQAAAIAGVFTAAGNALNDYHDRDVDRINHPDRPIPAGLVPPDRARWAALLLFAPTVPWAALLGGELLLVVLVNLALMLSYERAFKRRGFRGNLLIAWLVASLFLFGGLAVSETGAALQRTAILALLAFLATLGREVVKDVEDVAGDWDRRTLPMILGPDRAGHVAAGLFLVAVGLSGLPVLLGILGVAYAAAVLVADAILIYAARHSARKPALSQRAAKLAMLVALVAFLLGGLP